MTVRHRRRNVALVAVVAVIAVPVALGVGAPAFAETPVSDWVGLRAAFAASPLGSQDTIVLGGDITAVGGEGLVVPHADGGDGASITLDLNGHTLSIPRPSGTRYAAGIGVYAGASLTVDDSAGGGRLAVVGNDWGAGIGADTTDSARIGRSLGSVTIAGGTVDAQGGKGAAGIGNASYATGGRVTVSGGTVSAAGGYEAAGIGGSYYAGYDSQAALGAEVAITGGTVNARGGDHAAAIGGGYTAVGSRILIENAMVNAVAGADAAAIGTGPYTGYYPSHRAGSIDIRSSTVAVQGSGAGAAIGGGREALVPSITIVDSRIDARAGTGTAAGIGSGSRSVGSAPISITGSTVTARGAGEGDEDSLFGGAGIGAGLDPSSYADSSIRITGSTIDAVGGGRGAGIGGGGHRYPNSPEGNVDSIEIIASHITALGGPGGAGIGGGGGQVGTSVTVAGASTVDARGGPGDAWGMGGAGIGSGMTSNLNRMDPGTLAVSGGLVEGSVSTGGSVTPTKTIGALAADFELKGGVGARLVSTAVEPSARFIATGADGVELDGAGHIILAFVAPDADPAVGAEPTSGPGPGPGLGLGLGEMLSIEDGSTSSMDTTIDRPSTGTPGVLEVPSVPEPRIPEVTDADPSRDLTT